MKIQIMGLLVSFIVIGGGCSNDDGNSGDDGNADASARDAGGDTRDKSDAENHDAESSDSAGGDMVAMPVVVEQWVKIDGCVISRAVGPVVFYAEHADPSACVRVVAEQSEEEGEYAIDVRGGYRSTTVQISDGTCDGQFEDLSSGVAAYEATGNIGLDVTHLGSPVAIPEANLEIIFPEDAENPLGAVTARLSYADEQGIELSPCM